MQIERVSSALASNGFAYLRSEDWPQHHDDARAWASFAVSWNRLVPDPYMKPGDGFRHRRFGKFLVDARGATAIEPLDDLTFFQSTDVNSYAGGIERKFSPLERDVRDSAILGATMRTCLQAIHGSGIEPPRRWRVYVHQFRIDCAPSVVGRPTPEGLHRDGHDFISLHLIERAQIDGGVSSVCDADRRPLLEVTLERPMDGFLIDDRALMHDVSPIRPSGDGPGHRDMLVIDYNREG